MWKFLANPETLKILVGAVLFIFYVSLAIIIGKFHYEDYKEKKKKLNDIMSFCNKKTYTFAELREELPQISNLTYNDLFEKDFKLTEVKDQIKVEITLYYSEKETEEKLWNLLSDKYASNCKIGCIHIK